MTAPDSGPAEGDLGRLGWDGGHAQAFADLKDPALVPGRVAHEERRRYGVITAAGEVSATLAGRLFHMAGEASALPAVGDWVALARLPGESRGVIRHLLPRRTRLARCVAGRETREQVLAANVDLAFVVQSLDGNFNPRRLERFLMMVHDGGVRPIVVLNKADLCPDVEALRARASAVCARTPVLITSVRRRLGIKAMAAAIRPSETVAFIGSSGVGKSSLINCLCGEPLLPTLEVRESDSKGRHATTWRELIALPGGGLVVDTPGLRELQAWSDQEGLAQAFPEILELAAGCRFRDCRHGGEPGCEVRSAVEFGSLPRARYDAYLKLDVERLALAGRRQEQARSPTRPKSQKAKKRRPGAEDVDGAE
ncbi:MAG: ribosome small subunit-dependent GTPase A [Verrucomicrobiae bacterium]|nr:ribosome small subunit-dependent GTPase A [Verrucomicrobiae bacterium]